MFALRSVPACLLPSCLPLLLSAGLFTACAPKAETPIAAIDVPAIERPAGETPDWWYLSGAAHAARNGAMQGKAKNVILFLGDGMSLTTVAAARILAGQRAGQPGEETLLSWEHFPHTALSRTYNTNAQTPDSAGTMTAIATGVKSHAGAIGVSAGTLECADSRGKELQSWLRLADDAGLASGIISTARITHATPAAMYAHVPHREWENDSELSPEAVANGCRDIAQQLLDFEPGRGPLVVLGGGRREFLPATTPDPEYPDKTGKRQDGRDLTAEWQAAHPDGKVVWNTRQFRAAGDHGPLLGLFEPSHMQYDHDRNQDEDGEPELAELTRAAITRLSQHPDGYVLMVEGARIDHANHEGNAYRALDETIAMARAVQVAAEMTSPEDTLIIVTADHSHTMNFVGYPGRGNPILGKTAGLGVAGPTSDYMLDAFGKPYTTLSYANGPGHLALRENHDHDDHTTLPRGHHAAYARPDLSEVDTEHPDYLQEAAVPMHSETHGGDDVGVWSRGPGSHALRGSIEQHVIYHVLVQATPKLRQQLCQQGGCNADGVPVQLPVFTHPGL